MLASLAGYNMLSNINKNVYILVVNPSKYFTNQDVQANIPIIYNSFFSNGQFRFQIIRTRGFSGQKMSMYSIGFE